MKTLFATLYFFYLSGNTLFAQESNTIHSLGHNSNTFTLKGTINIDTGRISLVPLGKNFYPDDSSSKEAAITNGQFTLTGTAPYPLGAMLLVREGDGYVTGMFFIESGTQTIICNKDSLRETPKIINNTMNELKSDFRDAFITYSRHYYKLDVEWDSLAAAYKNNSNIPDINKIKWKEKSKELSKEYYKTLLAYTENHPDSYVALWKLAWSVELGYAPIYDTIYTQFSNELKNTYTGKSIKKELDALKNMDIGKAFPN